MRKRWRHTFAGTLAKACKSAPPRSEASALCKESIASTSEGSAVPSCKSRPANTRSFRTSSRSIPVGIVVLSGLASAATTAGIISVGATSAESATVMGDQPPEAAPADNWALV